MGKLLLVRLRRWFGRLHMHMRILCRSLPLETAAKRTSLQATQMLECDGIDSRQAKQAMQPMQLGAVVSLRQTLAGTEVSELPKSACAFASLSWHAAGMTRSGQQALDEMLRMVDEVQGQVGLSGKDAGDERQG